MPDARRIGSLSIQARLTLWYCLVLLVVLLVCGIAVQLLLRRLEYDRFDAELGGSTQLLAEAIARELDEELILTVAVAEMLDDQRLLGRTVVVVDGRGVVLAARGDDPSPELVAGAADFSERGFSPLAAQGGWRAYGARATALGVSYGVIVAGPTARIEANLADLRRILFIGIPVALLCAAAGGVVIARRGLTPLTRLADEARGMRDERSDLRLTHPGTRDELATVTEEFNGLLGRLDCVLTGQRQFMADASHELRTPVSVIRNATDVTMSQPVRSPDEYAASLTIIGEQAKRLTRIVDDMFLLARADAGGQKLQCTRFYLDELIDECVRGIRVLADSRGLRLDVATERDVEIEADEELVRRMVMNVLDNAVRHAPANERVTARLQRRGPAAELTVWNGGSAIAPEDRERIFERFVRLDPSRGRTDSAGLGLPIARWIAEAHGGSLRLSSERDEGVEFVARLPVQSLFMTDST